MFRGRLCPPYTAPYTAPSRIHLRDELRIEIRIERIRTALAAETGILDAAEAYFRQRQAVVVDRHHPAFDRMADRFRRPGRARIRIGGEAVGQTVGLADHLLERIEGIDDRDRAERFLVHDARLARHVREHGRLEEITLVADPSAASFDLGALGDRIGDEALDGVKPAAVGERAHAGLLLEPVPDLDGLGGGDKLVDELAVDR